MGPHLRPAPPGPPGRSLQERVIPAVPQHLLDVALGEVDPDVDDLPVLDDRGVDGIDESGVGGQVELGVAVQDLLVELRIDPDAVVLDQGLGRLVVALARDPLDLGQEPAVERPQLLIVVDDEVGLAVPGLFLDDVLGLPLLVDPVGDHGPAAHVGLLDRLAELDPRQLGHQAVADLEVVFGLGRLEAGQEAQLDHLVVHHIVEGEEVGPRLLDRRVVVLERLGPDAGQELARAVAEDLVEVGVDVPGQGAVGLGPLEELRGIGELRRRRAT